MSELYDNTLSYRKCPSCGTQFICTKKAMEAHLEQCEAMLDLGEIEQS